MSRFPNLDPILGTTDAVKSELAIATGTEFGRQQHELDLGKFAQLADQLGLNNTDQLTSLALRVSPHDLVYRGEETEGLLWVNVRQRYERKPLQLVDNRQFVTGAIALAMLEDRRFNPRVARDRKFDPAFNIASVVAMVGGAAAGIFNRSVEMLPPEPVPVAVFCAGFVLAAGQTIHGQPNTIPFITYPLISRITRAHRPPKGVDLDQVPPIVRVVNKES